MKHMQYIQMKELLQYALEKQLKHLEYTNEVLLEPVGGQH